MAGIASLAIGLRFTRCEGHLLADGELLNGFFDVNSSHNANVVLFLYIIRFCCSITIGIEASQELKKPKQRSNIVSILKERRTTFIPKRPHAIYEEWKLN
jgi:hypothetical protein